MSINISSFQIIISEVSKFSASKLDKVVEMYTKYQNKLKDNVSYTVKPILSLSRGK